MNEAFEKWRSNLLPQKGWAGIDSAIVCLAWEASRRETLKEVLEEINNGNGVTKLIYATTLYSKISKLLEDSR